MPRLGRLRSVSSEESRGEALLTLLREAARAGRAPQPKAFYSIRSVSEHFKIPLSTVCQVYERLKTEGVLHSIRGSKTVLGGTDTDRKVTVRTIAGLPIAVGRFATQQDYRMFFLRLRCQLRTRGLVGVLAFFEPREASQPEFCERLIAYQADTVIWFLPSPEVKDTVARLTDKGIRVIGVSEEPVPFIHHNYHVSREEAVSKGLASWREAGIRSAVVIRQEGDCLIQETLNVERPLREAGLEYKSRTLAGMGKLEVFVNALGRKQNEGIIFPSGRFAALLACRAPDATFDLMRRARVMLAKGPVNTPFARIPENVPVDLVWVDWQLVAARIADDVIGGAIFQAEESAMVFDAQWLPRVMLKEFAQEIGIAAKD